MAMVMGQRISDQTPLGREIWQHSVYTSIALRLIARYIPSVPTSGALTAGLLHDIGLIAMVAIEPNFAKVASLEGEGRDQQLIRERILFGMDHSQLGSMLLESWGLPDLVVDAARLHHRGTQESIASAMRIAENIADDPTPDIDILVEEARLVGLRLTGHQLEIAIDVFREEAAALVEFM
jgi:putative nucleotidyltransferase with HDIG domain